MWFYLNDSYRERLRQNGLKEFDDFMTFSSGTVLKRLPSRTIIKIELLNGEKMATFFLKRHKGTVKPFEMLRALFSGFSLSWGRKEWEVIEAFRRCGIPALTPVAAGEKISLFRQESFLMTEELIGFQSLDTFLRNYFSPPLAPEKMLEKRAIIKEVAETAKKMHQAGLNHRDFYCCHIFIRRTEDGQREWRVLDLQRVDRRRWLRNRWIIKDLAALNYSAPDRIITKTDRLRFLVHYMDGINRARQNRFLIRQVMRKTRKINRHDQKLQARKLKA
ncbi:MAG: hypothetical protein HZA18_00270 [Nitrospirae bacterium]|nr:hypothetical protein [Nitrospirota bacterium]